MLVVAAIFLTACAVHRPASTDTSVNSADNEGPARQDKTEESRYNLVLRDIQMAVLVIQNDSDNFALQYLYFCDQKMRIEYSGKWPLSPRVSAAVGPDLDSAETALNVIMDLGQIRAGCWKGSNKAKAELEGKDLMKKIGRLHGYANRAAVSDPEEHPHSFYLVRRLNRRL
jgi:hypothetical protein